MQQYQHFIVNSQMAIILKRKILFLTLLLALILPLMAATQPSYAQSTNINLNTLSTCNYLETASIDGLHVGAVVVNLESGIGCAEHLDDPFPVASIGKLFVLGAYLELVALGRSSFDDTIVFTRDYWMGGRNACLSDNDIGRSLTLGFLSEIMISCSDNPATWMLMDSIGWETVQNYINRLGIDGISPVIPYSEVDRLKLRFVDERWANVPRAMASRFYRQQRTEGLVPTFFDETPEYILQEIVEANESYFETYDFNQITPRAMANYFIKLRNDMELVGTTEWQVAYWFFNTLMLTQRQYSAQSIPGTVYVGAKNGTDFGLKAEVNVMFSSFVTRIPQSIAIIFAHQDDFSSPDLQPPNNRTGVINDFVLELAPRIGRILYPDFVPPEVVNSTIMNLITVQPESLIERCWIAFQSTNFEAKEDLESCWRSLPKPDSLTTAEDIGLGMVLYNLFELDTRLSLIFTAPSGQQFSYQHYIFFEEDARVFWYHPVDSRGVWQVDVYLNLQHVFTQQVLVRE
jgi:hypothetical protein